MATEITKALDKARRHVFQGELEKALKVLGRIAEKYPTDAEALVEAGKIHQRSRQAQDAVAAYVAAGRRLLQGGKIVEAVTVFRDMALPLMPDEADLLEETARSLEMNGCPGEANCYYMYAAAQHIHKGAYEKAGELLKIVCASETDNASAMIQLGETLLLAASSQGTTKGSGYRSSAFEYLQAAFAILEKETDDNCGPGSVSLEEGAAAEGEPTPISGHKRWSLNDYLRLGERIVFLQPENRKLREKLVRKYMGLGEYAGALAHLGRWLQHEGARGDGALAVELAAEVFARMGEGGKAVQVLQQAEQICRERGLNEEATRLLSKSLKVGTGAEAERDCSESPVVVPQVDVPSARDVAGFGVEHGECRGGRDSGGAAVSRVVVTPPVPGSVSVEAGGAMVCDVLAEADFFMKEGLLETAESVLVEGVEMFPGDDVVARHLARVRMMKLKRKGKASGSGSGVELGSGIGELGEVVLHEPGDGTSEMGRLEELAALDETMPVGSLSGGWSASALGVEYVTDAEVRLELGKAYWEMGLTDDAYAEALVAASCPGVGHEGWLSCRLDAVHLLCFMGKYLQARETLKDTMERGVAILTQGQMALLKDELTTVGAVADAMADEGTPHRDTDEQAGLF